MATKECATTFALIARDLQRESVGDLSAVTAKRTLLLGYEAVKDKQMEAIQAFVSGRDTFLLCPQNMEKLIGAHALVLNRKKGI